MLGLTGVVDARQMRAQYLDKMDIERERGITIKAQNVRLPWTADDGRTYVLNMIDTPGHVDFTYEVSRSLAACEGTLLLVDAAQGIEAQTLANLYLALENDLHIIPVLNKIDLPAAQPEKYAEEIAKIIGCEPDDVLRISAKTGQGVPDVLNAIVPRRAGADGRPGRPRPGDDLRLGLRRLPRRHHLRPRHRRPAVDQGPRADDEHAERARDPRGRRRRPGDEADRVALGRRGRLRHPGREERPAGPRRRHPHHGAQPGHRVARRLPRPHADGVLRPVPARRQRLPGAARGAGQAAAQRRRAGLRAGDARRPSASASASASSACCTWRSCASGSSASTAST